MVLNKVTNKLKYKEIKRKIKKGKLEEMALYLKSLTDCS
jgi:hypothetical protein